MSDERFSKVLKDPRFRRYKKKEGKVKIDSRFAKVLDSGDEGVGAGDRHSAVDYSLAAPVDKYGRKGVKAKNEDLKKYYRLASSSESDEDTEDKESHGGMVGVRGISYARGKDVPLDSSSDTSSEQEDDDSDISSKDYEEALGSNPLLIEEASIPKGEPSARFAVLNMDWDNIEPQDLFQLFTSFKPALGKVLSVNIYMSDFGKKRIAHENLHGPPIQIYKNSEDVDALKSESDCFSEDDDRRSNNAGSIIDDESSVEEVVSEVADSDATIALSEDEDTSGRDFNEAALRTYQLERLRYYYAIVDCDSIETATAIYNSCDGREFEKSCNFLDLRFVPEDEIFLAENLFKSFDPNDGSKIFENYRPKDFVTNILQHSKVKLTWDEEDPNRVKITKARFSKDKLDEMDFKSYLASSSSSEDDDAVDKYKALLSNPEASVFSRGVDEEMEMEATFFATPDANDALSSKEAGETVFHENLRKQREKKKAAKQALRGTQAAYEASKPEEENSSYKHKETRKKKRKNDNDDDYAVDLQDSRFAALLDDPKFAIDPSNPAFKNTKAMRRVISDKKLLKTLKM